MKQTLLKTLFTILFLSFTTYTFAQQIRTITGKITDAQGKPIQGVNIVEKSNDRPMKSVSDANGVYEISTSNKPEMVLIFSLAGYQLMEEKIGDRTVIDVVLKKALPKKLVPTSVGTHRVATHNLKYSTDIFKGIQNQVAGSWITTSSGAPGAATQMLLRGHRSIHGDNSPLVIIDGMPMMNFTVGNSIVSVDQSNRLMDISPQDIASVEVINSFSPRLLRYGIQARNGAVIINTKQGIPHQKPTVTFFTRFTVDRINRLPELQNQYAQGLPGISQAIYQGPETQNRFAWGPLLSSLQYNGVADLYDSKGRLIPNTFNIPGAIPSVAYDPYDFFVNGFTLDNNLAIRGGDYKHQYYISIGRMQRNGNVPLSTFYRNSVLIGLRQKMSKSITVGTKLYFFNTHGQRIQKGIGASSVTRGVMRTPPSFDNSNGNGNGLQAIRESSTYSAPLLNIYRSFSGAGIENPFASARNPYSDRVSGQLFQFDFDWKFAPNWRVDAALFFDTRRERREIAFDTKSASVTDGFYAEQNHRFNDLYLTAAFHYNRQFKNLTLNASAGYWRKFQTTFNDLASVSPLSSPGDFSLDTGQNFGRSESTSDQTLQNLYLQFSLNYQQAVFLEAGVVNVSNSILNNSSGLAPSAGIAVDLARLIVPNNAIFSKLLLSANYSQIGGDADIIRRRLTKIGFSRLTLALGTTLNNLGFSNAFDNEELRPETTTLLDFGVQLNLLKNRVQFQANRFSSNSTDQIISNVVNGINRLVNGGTVTTDGWEFQLSGHILSNHDFQWSVGVNLTRFHSIVNDIPNNINRINMGGLNQYHSSAINGQPYGVFYGNNYQKNDQGELVVGNDGFLTLGIPGSTGNPTPDWLWGITNNFRWKGLQINMRWDIRRGGDVWNGTQANLDYYGNSKSSGELRTVTGFVYPGVKLDGSPNNTPINFYNLGVNTIGRVSPLTAFGEFGVAEANMQDASWIRFRELIIGYTLPQKWTKKLSISELTISFIGRNLLLITDYTGIDPETSLTGDSNGFGMDLFNMPQTRSVGGAFSFKF